MSTPVSLLIRSHRFLDARDYPPVDGRREALLAHFNVPEFVASRTCFELNGYFGSRASYDETKNHVIGCSKCQKLRLSD